MKRFRISWTSTIQQWGYCMAKDKDEAERIFEAGDLDNVEIGDENVQDYEIEEVKGGD